jgi:CheY-like chemotaxis protein
MRDLIAESLIEHGYRVVTARHGMDALKLMGRCKPELLIVDWMMPTMSGPSLVKNIRESDDNKTLPIIMLTAKTDQESKISGTISGVNGYLGKPFDKLELTSMVNNLLKLKEKEKKLTQLNQHLKDNVLKRFLPESLVNKVVSGERMIDDKPNIIPITVLFLDICNFSSKSFELGPLKMVDILNQYINVMYKIIFDHGGTVDKFIGDSIMAFFGAPEVLTALEQTKAAISCAREMGKALEKLNVEWSKKNYPTFNIRIGMHYGASMVGYVCSNVRTEYTAIV